MDQYRAALITGASSGIGEAFAEVYARQGLDLVLVARSKDKLDAIAARLAQQYSGIRVEVIAADLSQPYPGAALLQHYFGAQAVELLVVVPTAVDDGSGVSLRLTRANDHKLIVQVQQMARSAEGHTIVLRTKLPRGRYRAEAWMLNTKQTALENEFDYQGEDVFEVPLHPRAGR